MTVDATLERTHYDTLGVPADADGAAIKNAYRRLAKELHPDVAPDGVDTADRFALVNVAYAVLSAHRALFTTGMSTRVLVVSALLAVAMPTLVALTSGTEPWPLAVALLTGVPLVVAGELIRDTRSTR